MQEVFKLSSGSSGRNSRGFSGLGGNTGHYNPRKHETTDFDTNKEDNPSLGVTRIIGGKPVTDL